MLSLPLVPSVCPVRCKPFVTLQRMQECGRLQFLGCLHCMFIQTFAAVQAQTTCVCVCLSQVQQAGAIITAVCSASLALVMAFHVTQCSKGGAACGLLDVSGSRVSLSVPILHSTCFAGLHPFRPGASCCCLLSHDLT